MTSALDGVGVLVTGGAGYIGCHVVYELLAVGCRVVVLDDLSTGCRELVAPGTAFVNGKAGDATLLGRLIRDHDIEAVIHLAGSVVVAESVAQPLLYYRNNVVDSWSLIAACVEHEVAQFLFSSSAAVYGNPTMVPVAEDCPPAPGTPYGRSKLMCEWLLADACAASAMQGAALRYFNVAGADPEGRCGQVTPSATHLIKVACEAAVGRRQFVEVYGTDYPTSDGTCIRDYIHVSDLAAAHVAVLDYLRRTGGPLTLNCGYGRGCSVREVLSAVARRAGRALETRDAPRRLGDVPEVVADSTRLVAALDWRPRYADLDFIVSTALAWERKLLASALAGK